MLQVLYKPRLEELHRKVSGHIPDGRKVRDFIVALEHAGDNKGAGNPIPADVTHIRADDELDAFLCLTEPMLVKILVILHTGVRRVNTRPPTGANKETYYFKVGRFDELEYYVDMLEDSDKEVGKRAGGKMGIPRKDHKFEELLKTVRRRVPRQKQLLET